MWTSCLDFLRADEAESALDHEDPESADSRIAAALMEFDPTSSILGASPCSRVASIKAFRFWRFPALSLKAFTPREQAQHAHNGSNIIMISLKGQIKCGEDGSTVSSWHRLADANTSSWMVIALCSSGFEERFCAVSRCVLLRVRCTPNTVAPQRLNGPAAPSWKR